MTEYNGAQQRDIVLSPNEFIFVQNNTNGVIKTYTGPITITISTQDSLVYFSSKSKRFIATTDVNKAKQLMVLPPENWYAVLKNPAVDGSFPETAKAVVAPPLKSGCKINVTGPAAFALYPGQMARVIKGHALRSNQYLLARVYEAEQANNNTGEVLDVNGNKVQSDSKKYVNGELLVVKGTEVSFYIPPTGIEVIPLDDEGESYVRDAVTLERLEYCILKDEDGNKRYVHGPEVVFPKPTETFVSSTKGGYIFRAIELSKISGIYVKVIAEYTEKNADGAEIVHPVGEELFITGHDQMIYYPRPEHAVISYDGKIMHHAIAIPLGEGRYIMDRLTGEIKTVCGPAMYLPDPRFEVVVKRKLTNAECNLYYPGNADVLSYNEQLTEKSVEKMNKKSINMDDVAFMSCASFDSSLAALEAKANISRGTSYTKPRTITLDNKYDGVVAIEVWEGYAVNIRSKSGQHEVVCGPALKLLDYDQTLERLADEKHNPIVYLPYKNRVITCSTPFVSQDNVAGSVDITYHVSFDETQKDKWFSLSDYADYLRQKESQIIRDTAKMKPIEYIYNNYSDLFTTAIAEDVVDYPNGMVIDSCEVNKVCIAANIEDLLLKNSTHQIQTDLDIRRAQGDLEITKLQAEVDKAQYETNSKKATYKMQLQREEALQKVELQGEINRKKEAEAQAAAEAERDLQVLQDAIAEAKRKRTQAEYDLANAQKEKENALEQAKMDAYAGMVRQVMAAVTPDLIAAMQANTNADITKSIMENISPYALASGNESATDVVNRLLRGTPLEEVVARNCTGFNIGLSQ